MEWTNLICLIWFLECFMNYCIVVKGLSILEKVFHIVQQKIVKLIPGISPEI